MDMQYFQQGSTTVTAGGTAQAITVGFKPSYVKVINVNNLAMYEHFLAMDDGTSIDTFSHTTAQIVANAADAITLTNDGFIMGTDIVDTTSDVIHWLVAR